MEITTNQDFIFIALINITLLQLKRDFTEIKISRLLQQVDFKRITKPRIVL